jgi:pimeloyl-ACP methyl ester carboxylesterase
MFIDIDGNKVFALSFGRGPRTFLSHSGWIGNFEDWIATLAPLSESWRTVVYDHRGAGETVVPVDSISTEPGAAQRQRVPPSNWPGASFEEHLEWFAERCVPEPGSAHIRRWAKNILSRSTAEVADRIMMMDAKEQIDWPTELQKLTIPTLILHGELDPFYQTSTMHYAQSIIPHSKLVIMEGSGHLPAMTRPLDVAREINLFFDAAA